MAMENRSLSRVLARELARTLFDAKSKCEFIIDTEAMTVHELLMRFRKNLLASRITDMPLKEIMENENEVPWWEKRFQQLWERYVVERNAKVIGRSVSARAGERD